MKKTLIKKAILLKKEWDVMEDKMRNYDRRNWHCVNVKRFNDFVDFGELIKKYPIKYKMILIDFFNDEKNNEKTYYYWLEDMAEMLKLELGDIEELTKDEKNFHLNFRYIDDFHLNGRSGGWFCFEDNLSKDIGDAIQSVIDWDLNDMCYYEMCYNDLDLGDIETSLKEIEDMIEEVKFAKNYIAEFNKNINYKEEVKHRIDEKIEEIEAEAEALRNSKDLFITNIKKKSEEIQELVTIFEKDKKLKSIIQRHLTGILSSVKKN